MYLSCSERVHISAPEGVRISSLQKKLGKTVLDAFQESVLEKPLESASAEEVGKVKKNHAIQVSQWIIEQASSENPAWHAFGDMLMSVLDRNMSADVCGATPFTFYQFVDFLSMNRQKWKKNLEKDDAKYEVLPDTEKEKLRFVTSFVQESKYGFTSQQIYEINMSLKKVLPDKKSKFMYTISWISVKGGCSEHGTVDPQHIPSRELEAEIWNPTIVLKFLMLFTPKPYRGYHQDADKIPTLWLNGLEKDEHLTASVCNPKTGIPRRYTEAEFRRWYELFGRMWRPKRNSTEFATVQKIHQSTLKIVARVTYRLVLGLDWNGNAKEVDWNVKIIGELNLHDNKKWTISGIDVSCPPGINLLGASYEAYRNITGFSFVSLIPVTKRVYQDLGFLKYLVKNESQVEISFCGNKIDGINNIGKSFWAPGTNFTSTFIESVALPELDNSLAKEDTNFTLYIGLGTYEKISKQVDEQGDSILLFEAKWHFYIQWDPIDLFYYIKRIVFECPGWTGQVREYEWPIEETPSFLRIGK
ncbi:unnamed protein product [Caenorhabditis sp. 36 PRJEB53466]|nr:unnamed protein product [Caenorhabditis sp. 36 PRJEB53466]